MLVLRRLTEVLGSWMIQSCGIKFSLTHFIHRGTRWSGRGLSVVVIVGMVKERWNGAVAWWRKILVRRGGGVVGEKPWGRYLGEGR